MNTTTMKRGLSATSLKVIAVLAMTCDHLAWAIWPGFQTNPLAIAMHVFGRLTAPIMMFLIAEGLSHTRSRMKYLGRLLAFTVIGHFAYAYLFGLDYIPLRTGIFNQTSVFWPYAMGVLAVMAFEAKAPWFKPWMRQLVSFLIVWAAFPGDWSAPAAWAITLIYRHRGNFKKQMLSLMMCISVYAAVYMIFLNPLYGALQLSVALAIPLLKSYNGERGGAPNPSPAQRFASKWFFYAYYPVHLVAIALIFGRTFVNG